MWFLGTGAGRPSKLRNVSGAALQLPEPSGGWWLFDVGEATQHQLMRTPLKLSKLELILITHLHGDHLYGLPGLLSSRSFNGGITPLRLIGPKGIRTFIDTVFAISETYLDYDLIIDELDEVSGVIYTDNRFTIETAMLEHRINCYGYRIIENDIPGRLQVEKLKAFGLAPGPQYGKLKRGESVTLADGSIIFPKDVTEAIQPGRVVTVLGDTKPCSNATRLAEDADLLVHEATFSAELGLKAHEFGHSTTTDAATTAVEAKAKGLVLTHFSGRYSEEDLLQLEQEAAAIFKPVYAATDLMMIEIKRCLSVQQRSEA